LSFSDTKRVFLPRYFSRDARVSAFTLPPSITTVFEVLECLRLDGFACAREQRLVEAYGDDGYAGLPEWVVGWLALLAV
jgi:hypothetical protein